MIEKLTENEQKCKTCENILTAILSNPQLNRGTKECVDIAISVTENLYERLKEKKWKD
jgi:hypothetical protein